MKKFAAATGILMLLALVVIGPPACQFFLNYNWRTVEEQAFYGSRQMGGEALAATIDDYGIQTVVNCRGNNEGSDWYDDEVAVCERLGVKHVNFSWSKSRLPDPESLARFVELMDAGDKPFLVHCQGGTHRTGIAAAIYRLMQGETPEQAREEFKLGFNDAPIGELVDLYESSDMPFRQWAVEAYPGMYEIWQQRREAEKAKEEQEAE